MVAGIHRAFGDQLYAKHDYDAAVQQYLATISFLEPSYVIRKFLDAQRINNLTLYLEALHDEVRMLCCVCCVSCVLPMLSVIKRAMTCTEEETQRSDRAVPRQTTPRCCSTATPSCRTLPSWTSLSGRPAPTARRSWHLMWTPQSGCVRGSV